MMFTFNNLMDALVGYVEDAGKIGLRVAGCEPGFDDLVAFAGGEGRIRRLRNSVKAFEDAENG